ncbi:MAG: APC family permease [Clostridia bacterium]|nr:APC family permease [Clostridia bacterium]
MKNKPTNNRKGVSVVDFFCIGFGAIVGVGWAVSINSWMLNSGGPIPAALGFILAFIMMIPVSLAYCELVPMYPEAGGGMVFALQAFGRLLALFSGWAAFGAFVAIIPWEAIQITTMLGYLIPGLTSGEPLYTLAGTAIYPATIAIGTFFSVVLFLLNRKGLAMAAKVQKFLCFFLIATALIGAVASVLAGSLSNLKPVYENVTGSALHKTFLGGTLSIIASAPFFLAGFETIPQGIESASGSVRSVGKTVVLSVLCSCLFYAVLLFCFGMAMPWQSFCQLEKPAAAVMMREVYPGTTGSVLYGILVVGAIAGLVTTWNGFFTASANLLMAMGRKNLVPSMLARQDENGIPVNGLYICLGLSLLGPLLGDGLIDTLTCFSTAAFVLSWLITAMCLVRLRYTRPELPRPYSIPGGLKMGWFSVIASAVVFILLLIPGNPAFVGWRAVITFLVWIAIGLLLFAVNNLLKKRSQQKT